MSASKIGFWARIGGMFAAIFLKGKDRKKALEVSGQVGDIADAVDESTRP